MAVVVKKGGTVSTLASAKDVLSKYQKHLGDSIGAQGGHSVLGDRAPTGMFPLDLALGGGLPRGKVTTIFGPESSAKTNLALKVIALHQIMHPELLCVFISIEGFDKPWAKLMGVDVDKLIVLYPSFAEQVVDMARDFISAPDCGVVVLDSIAAMISTQEAEKSAEGETPGGTARVIGKLVRQTTLALNDAEKEGRQPTLIYINQIRHKIGVMFGSPETTPGGFPPLFQSAIRLRVYGKNITDTKISQTMPIAKEVNFTVPKWKVPILSASGKFTMVTIPNNGFGVGECDDWNTISQHLKDYGQLAKAEGKGAKGWTMLGENYPTLDAAEEKLREPKFGTEVRQAIIQRSLTENHLLATTEDEVQANAVPKL